MSDPVKFDTRDLDGFIAAMEKLQDKQGQIVKKAAQKASNVVGKSIRSHAPKGETGNLKKGFEKKREKSKIANKAMYYYAVKSSMNNVFQKPIKNPGELGGKHKYWGYYPNSVEYGFLVRAKGGGLEYRRMGRRNDKLGMDAYSTNPFEKGGRKGSHVEIVKGFASRKVPGKHFTKEAAQAARPEFEKTLIDVGMKEVERIWKE